MWAILRQLLNLYLQQWLKEGKSEYCEGRMNMDTAPPQRRSRLSSTFTGEMRTPLKGLHMKAFALSDSLLTASSLTGGRGEMLCNASPTLTLVISSD